MTQLRLSVLFLRLLSVQNFSSTPLCIPSKFLLHVKFPSFPLSFPSFQLIAFHYIFASWYEIFHSSFFFHYQPDFHPLTAPSIYIPLPSISIFYCFLFSINNSKTCSLISVYTANQLECQFNRTWLHTLSQGIFEWIRLSELEYCMVLVGIMEILQMAALKSLLCNVLDFHRRRMKLFINCAQIRFFIPFTLRCSFCDILDVQLLLWVLRTYFTSNWVRLG